MTGRVIVFEGGPGAGKSTLCLSIQEQMKQKGKKCVALVETTDPMLFEDMMKNPDAMFPFQLCMAATKIERIRRAIDLAAEGYIVLLDRGMVGDYAFAELAYEKKKLTDAQWRIYNSVVFDCPYRFLHSQPIIENTVEARLSAPTVHPVRFLRDESCPAGQSVTTVYLKVPPTVSYNRVQARGNATEQKAYNVDFFTKMSRKLEHLFENQGDNVTTVNFAGHFAVDPVTGLYGAADTCAAVALCGL